MQGYVDPKPKKKMQKKNTRKEQVGSLRRKLRRRNREVAIRNWRRKIVTSKGRPAKGASRWVWGGRAMGSLVARVACGVVCGPRGLTPTEDVTRPRAQNVSNFRGFEKGLAGGGWRQTNPLSANPFSKLLKITSAWKNAKNALFKTSSVLQPQGLFYPKNPTWSKI